MNNLFSDLFSLLEQYHKKQHWLLKLINYILLVLLLIIIVITVIIGIAGFFRWGILTKPTAKTETIKIKDGFADKSLYDLMEKEAQISNDVYIKKIRDADVIQSNPWIMIEPINKTASIHPRGVLDRLTGQQTDRLSMYPRTYYEYSDVLYTGLPL